MTAISSHNSLSLKAEEIMRFSFSSAAFNSLCVLGRFMIIAKLSRKSPKPRVITKSRLLGYLTSRSLCYTNPQHSFPERCLKVPQSLMRYFDYTCPTHSQLIWIDSTAAHTEAAENTEVVIHWEKDSSFPRRALGKRKSARHERARERAHLARASLICVNGGV